MATVFESLSKCRYMNLQNEHLCGFHANNEVLNKPVAEVLNGKFADIKTGGSYRKPSEKDYKTENSMLVCRIKGHKKHCVSSGSESKRRAAPHGNVNVPCQVSIKQNELHTYKEKSSNAYHNNGTPVLFAFGGSNKLLNHTVCRLIANSTAPAAAQELLKVRKNVLDKYCPNLVALAKADDHCHEHSCHFFQWTHDPILNFYSKNAGSPKQNKTSLGRKTKESTAFHQRLSFQNAEGLDDRLISHFNVCLITGDNEEKKPAGEPPETNGEASSNYYYEVCTGWQCNMPNTSSYACLLDSTSANQSGQDAAKPLHTEVNLEGKMDVLPLSRALHHMGYMCLRQKNILDKSQNNKNFGTTEIHTVKMVQAPPILLLVNKKFFLGLPDRICICLHLTDKTNPGELKKDKKIIENNARIQNLCWEILKRGIIHAGKKCMKDVSQWYTSIQFIFLPIDMGYLTTPNGDCLNVGEICEKKSKVNCSIADIAYTCSKFTTATLLRKEAIEGMEETAKSICKLDYVFKAQSDLRFNLFSSYIKYVLATFSLFVLSGGLIAYYVCRAFIEDDTIDNIWLVVEIIRSFWETDPNVRKSNFNQLLGEVFWKLSLTATIFFLLLSSMGSFALDIWKCVLNQANKFLKRSALLSESQLLELDQKKEFLTVRHEAFISWVNVAEESLKDIFSLETQRCLGNIFV